MKKWSLVLFFHCLTLFLLCACQERMKPAPVTELKWEPFNNKARSYTVRKGDTLYAIAFRYDMDVKKLMQINKLKDPYSLNKGQVLSLQALPEAAVRKKRMIHGIASPAEKINKNKLVQQKIQIVKTKLINTDSWLWPVKGSLMQTFNPGKGKKGIDIVGKKGMPIRAAATGVVAYAGNGLPGYGNLILLKHANQYLSAYAHNEVLNVKEGQSIKAGQVIAHMGKLNKSAWGLHFEIRKAGKPINPLKYLKKG